MRNNFILLIICLLMASPLFSRPSGNSGNESELSFLGLTTNERLVQLDYSIPYGGVVELHLFDENGDRVWYNTYAKDPGSYSIYIKRSGFRVGKAYSFQLKYKESLYEGEVRL